MLKKIVMTPLIAVAMLTAAPVVASAQNTLASATAGAAWSIPPAGSADLQKGFRDGVQSAQVDARVAKLYPAANRKVDAKSSNLYVHPPVKGAARAEYQSGFEAGYNAALQHGANS